MSALNRVEIPDGEMKAERMYVKCWSNKYITGWAAPMFVLGFTIHFLLNSMEPQTKTKTGANFLKVLMVGSMLSAVGVLLYQAIELTMTHYNHPNVPPSPASGGGQAPLSTRRYSPHMQQHHHSSSGGHHGHHSQPPQQQHAYHQ
jgi:hypothetical protein